MRSIEQSAKQKVIKPIIHTAQMYKYTSMIVRSGCGRGSLVARLERLEGPNTNVVFLGDQKARKFLEKQVFFHKFGQNLIDLAAQPINILCWVSQLYPRTNKWKKLRKMTYIFKIIQLSDKKVTDKNPVLEMI